MAFVVAVVCNINTTNEIILVGNYPTSCKGWQAFSCKNDALLNIFIKFRGTRGYQKVLSLRHFPHSDSTMLHT